ncbi:bifunctional [glutamine synthetase] adenylyltransferase/[glutamine synthetase]-adenylyl-L-tyrosine phosphorylase [Pseudooceanicola sediminis]|uniref:Bifunctional [glutamine synthetase] adenylyltransferase/[glutamine synthetase]-adenylyl-L-tyrosine phosphorylase n=1 Tax=Pseudooceanicola sediminis TaxID=2211117 RepID=A0A399J9N9_9RHOB|nr:bifunctional [glutamine synthetase] adenylyltransferase/[glutamine synthetase]-adenylyl-L-tyrosine phosphorylase [Pseudooceanicola sediminis]KAA2316801.1 bifunctional [glutamine synthetase] adenylyltransferase/[glutamine synthetase]-adenylyl-L-tyrosine phosphorylase [Puniceibacterium sp. HSS470]RII40742.1 bifunctional [glutamine synthetase] adenylyltransferase/[glutamine synthetase]-adenylyl-L-tyrosine phosphorylase [Pseudooceanicola sediminis]|tara:strand:- start:218036 stop:220924 length:2889 start_codon:yes stop_codon:yes gene_type:complete
MSDTLIPTRLPRPFDPDRGREARALFPDLDGDLAALIEGTAGCSPYLAGLMAREADWLPGALSAPLAALAAERDRLSGIAPDQIAPELRRGKRRMALLVALADLAGAWPLETVTESLSAFADHCVALAMRAALTAEIRRAKLPGMQEDDLETGCGLVALAMGKMGAGELNYSSDIDLIVLYDEGRYGGDAVLEARPALIRATRRMTATLNDITDEGYVFRTDLRLRPDPGVTPVCMGMAAAERYYERLGRTWERAAYIKARPAAGDIAAGARFLEDLRPFVWRRHLDFAAIQDAHDVRLAIRRNKGFFGPIQLAGHDMKLGRGGIREIEFFAQFHQIVAGGRDPSLRLPGTVPALGQLAERGWIPQDTANVLARHYRSHREVEHRVQMINDAQTHQLPGGAEGLSRLAAFMGRDAEELGREIKDRLEEVHGVTEAFFAPDTPGEKAPGTPGAIPAAGADGHRKDGTRTVGQDPAGAAAGQAEVEIAIDEALVARWRAYPALSSERARQIFDRLRPQLLHSLSRAARPDEALVAFDGFLRGLPAGVQLFSMFQANPQLIDLLGDITGTAPDLALYLSRNSAVFDAVIGGGFFTEWPGEDALCKELSRVLQIEEDYERKLDAARRWVKEWHFRIGVHHLRGLVAPKEAGHEYAELASVVLRVLWPVVQTEFATRHGPPPGRGAAVMGMGSMGAGRLNARSDLDLIVIYDAAGQETSQGRRPLASRTYYARLTQALVTALSAPMAEGRLYEVDMRLRPSGSQGPVATSWQSFRDYQETQAWTWEHLALTRARVIAGPEALSNDIMTFRRDLIARGRASGPVLRDVAEMRSRIAAAKGTRTIWDVKTGPGRNQEIELMAQAGGLIAGDPDGWIGEGLNLAVKSGWMRTAESDALLSTYRLLWNIGQVGKLLSGKALDPDEIGEGGRALLLRDTGAETIEALQAQVAASTEAAAAAIDAILEREADT